MKIKLAIFILSILMLSACSKSDADNLVDCIGDGLLTILSHSAATDNSLKIDFTVVRSKDPKIQSIVWNFGDNITQTSSATTISHTYSQAGSYQVKLNVKLDNGCSHDKTENITVK